MEEGRKYFEKWQGSHAWSQWVKPTLFVQNFAVQEFYSIASEIAQSLEMGQSSCMVIDLPGAQAVELGIDMAPAGFFPVPLYNGVNAPVGITPAIDNFEIQQALAKKADSIEWPKSGGPAFLLDSRRTYEKPGAKRFFDNRWVTLAQDFPSADKLKTENIDRCYVVTDQDYVRSDLKKILLQWQKSGIRIFLWRDGTFEETRIHSPTILENLFNWIHTALLGLSPNPGGGFGALVERSGG